MTAASSSRLGFSTVAPARAAARRPGPLVSTTTATPAAMSSATRAAIASGSRPGGRLPLMTTTDAARPSRVASATSSDASAGERAAPCSLKMLVSPLASSTIAMLRRVSPAIGTSAWRRPLRARSSASRAPVEPPAVARASTSCPSAASTRATLMPLPPARDAPAGTRWVSPGSSRSTCQVRSSAGFGVTVTITGRPPLRARRRGRVPRGRCRAAPRRRRARRARVPGAGGS